MSLCHNFKTSIRITTGKAEGEFPVKTKTFKFSDGSIQVSVENITEIKQLIRNNITHNMGLEVNCSIKSSDEVFILLNLVDAVKTLTNNSLTLSKLTLKFFPYARQDRVCSPGEALSLKVFGNLINTLNFQRVYLIDPHSDVAAAVINNSQVVSKVELFKHFENFTPLNLASGRWDYLISPDAGADKQVFELGRTFDIPVIRASKKRCVETGGITGTEVHASSEELRDKNVLIVDDICDGGYTFIKLAEALNDKEVGFVDLYVTHGIFSKGIDTVLNGGIDNIYTTDTFWGKNLIVKSPRFNVLTF